MKMNPVEVVAVLSTKGGVGKSTLAVNLAALCADAGLKVLLIDMDGQPSSTIYFVLVDEAPCGTFELMAQKETCAARLISKTAIPGLDIIASNDRNNLLPTILRNSPDGRIRLSAVLRQVEADYDLVILDTPGTQSILVEVAVLASTMAVSPINPETLSAREFRRGTVQLLDDLKPFEQIGAMKLPDIRAVLNKLDTTTDARLVMTHLRDTFTDEPRVKIMSTQIPNTVIFREAATRGIPAHRLETNQPSNRKRPAILQTMKALASELFPDWAKRLAAIDPHDFGTAGKETAVQNQEGALS